MFPFAKYLMLSVSLLYSCNQLHGQTVESRPISGREIKKYADFDRVINESMDQLGATAASFAVAHNGKVVYSRAYGWSEIEQSVPATPKTTFRIASVTKPFTAAIVRSVVAKNSDVKLDTRVFPFLKLQPAGGQLGDSRLNEITIEHLIDHKGGWDKSTTFDPTYRPQTICKSLKIELDELTKQHIVEYMLGHPLQHSPGETYAYSNFGYLVLGLVIEKVTGRPYEDAVDEFAKRLNVEVRVSRTNLADRNENEVAYPNESGLEISLRDSLGGLTCSAESLCKFIKRYWTDGTRRRKKERRSSMHYGRHRKSTISLVVYRTDGVDYAIIFNASRDKGYRDDIANIQREIDRTIEEIKRGRQ